MTNMSRRSFLARSAVCGAGPLAAALARPVLAGARPASAMRFGLVTYLWGKDMDLRALLRVCEESGLSGVELRTEHRHGVEPALTKAQRAEVRKRFEASPVALVGYGSNAHFHEDDPARLKQNIELTKAYVQLMHDCGGTGVKVKPNGLVAGVPHARTIEQIGRALNEVAAYGAQYGQQIRVEVHGRQTSSLPVMKAIFEVADHPNVGVCWNSNGTDLESRGLEFNFRLVQDRLGDTVHVRELDRDDYPYAELFKLFRSASYSGWILLEARTAPADPVAAMIRQRQAFEKLVGAAGS